MEKKNEGSSKGVMTGLGIAALVTAAAAAAGAVYLYGTDAGKKKRKQIKSWMLKMQAEVMDKIGDMKEWSEDAYNAAVDAVAEKYKALQGVDVAELATVASDLKKHWRTIRRAVEGGNKPAKKSAPKRKPAAKKKTA